MKSTYIEGNEWERPDNEADARAVMIAAENVRNYEDAALAALTMADYVGVRSADGAASFERKALVYATLHQADMALFIAENRQPVDYTQLT